MVKVLSIKEINKKYDAFTPSKNSSSSSVFKEYAFDFFIKVADEDEKIVTLYNESQSESDSKSPATIFSTQEQAFETDIFDICNSYLFWQYYELSQQNPNAVARPILKTIKPLALDATERILERLQHIDFAVKGYDVNFLFDSEKDRYGLPIVNFKISVDSNLSSVESYEYFRGFLKMLYTEFERLAEEYCEVV